MDFSYYNGVLVARSTHRIFMNAEVTINSQSKLGNIVAEKKTIWRDPRFWVITWAFYSLCAFAWLGYQNALIGYFCRTTV
jgi:hypothetical protein